MTPPPLPTRPPILSELPPLLPCLRCFSGLEPEDLRCPVCYLAIPERDRGAQPALSVQVLRCESCGAAMEYRAGLQAAQCAFCCGVLKLEEFTDPAEEMETRLPFKVDRAHATEAYRQWISRQGFFRPFNLASAARLETMRALSWAGWVVNVGARATWTADSDAGARKAKWAPHAGECQSEFSGLVIPATRGLSQAECERLVPTYDLRAALNASKAAQRDDAEVERFDVPRSFARSTILRAIQRLMETRIRAGEIPGSRFRNLQASIHLRRLATQRAGFPAYVIGYRYRGRLYRTVISGQDATCVIGEAPRSLGKLLLVIVAVILTLCALVVLLR